MLSTMKNHFIILIASIIFLSCEEETDLQNSPKKFPIDSAGIAMIKDYGPIASDGCGWVVELGNEHYSALYLPEILQKDSLYINSIFNGTDSSFVCFGGEEFPYLDVEIPTNLVWMHYKETQCTDPWGFEARNLSDKALAIYMGNYLLQNNLTFFSFKEYNTSGNIGFCEACSCPTGRNFILQVHETFVEDLKGIGFTTMDGCNYIDPINELSWLSELKTRLNQNQWTSRITQFEYNNSCAFLVEECYLCPDFISVVYDENGDEICASGGITGNSTCEDFYQNAINEIEIYYHE